MTFQWLGTLVVNKEMGKSDTKEKEQQPAKQNLGSDPPLTSGDHSSSLWPRPQGLQSDRLGTRSGLGLGENRAQSSGSTLAARD